MERTDRLRKRPEDIRYFYLGVGLTNIHIGLSHAGLQKADMHDHIHTLYVADLVTKKVQQVTLTRFLHWWRANYQDSSAEYVERGEVE